MRKINWYGDILTEKHFILPKDDDGLGMPIIKTPCYLSHPNEIPLMFQTQEDAKIKACPRCGGDVISATLTPPKMDVSHWYCLCGYRWDTTRGIYYQMSLFATNNACTRPASAVGTDGESNESPRR